MPLLLVKTLDLYLRRLSPVGRSLRHRRLVYIEALVLAIGVSGLLAVLAYTYLHGASEAERAIFLPVLIVAAYGVSGPILLIAEAARDKTGAFEAALSSMPIGRGHVRLLAWAPLCFIAGSLSMLLFIPIFAALTAIGLPFVETCVYSLNAMFLGEAASAFSIATIYLIFRGTKWQAIRSPVVVLFWIALTVAELFATVSAFGSRPRWFDHVLILPDVVLRAASMEQPQLLSLVGSFGLAVIFLLLVLVLAGDKYARMGYRAVRLIWPKKLRRYRFVGELLSALRNPSLAGNLISALLLNAFVVALYNHLNQVTQNSIVLAVVASLFISASVVVRLPRALFPRRRVVPQLVGLPTGPWQITQTSISAALYLITLAPLAFLLSSERDVSPLVLFCLGLGVFAGAHVAAWVFVVGLDNVLGQALSNLLCFVICAPLSYLLFQIADYSLTLCCALSGVIAAVSFIVARTIESKRWKYKTYSQPANVN